MIKLLERAEKALKEGAFDAAVETYEEILAEGKEGIVLVLKQLALLYLTIRKPLRALDCVNALSYFEQTAETFAYQSTVQARLGLDPLPSIYRALELEPTNRLLVNELLFNLATTLNPAAYLSEARRWAIPSSPRVASYRATSSLPRIGYVTGDAKQHVMDRILEPLLRYSSFETVIYDNTEKQDAKSAELRKFGTKWKYIVGLSAEAVAQQVRTDGIDILVDLSGLTAGNRLDVFALRPAPVQVTAFGCLFSTGMDCFDYRFADVEQQAHYSEPLWRLPSAIAPMHLFSELPVSPLPAKRTGSITFGYVNGLRKLSPGFISAVMEVLSAVPNSRLLVMTLGASDPATASSLLRRFPQHQDRIFFTESVGGSAFARLFAEIDIALDPFPYGGCMTTFDTLFHGVPIITSIPAGRVSADAFRLQTALGFPQFCGNDWTTVAQRVAVNPEYLAQVRSELRPRLLKHPAGRPEAWVRTLERAYTEMLPMAKAA